jgi:hypothetical protein
MVTRTRLPTYAINALEDILAIERDMRPGLRALVEYGRSRMDVQLLARLTPVVVGLADIQRIAKEARTGTYQEQP